MRPVCSKAKPCLPPRAGPPPNPAAGEAAPVSLAGVPRQQQQQCLPGGYIMSVATTALPPRRLLLPVAALILAAGSAPSAAAAAEPAPVSAMVDLSPSSVTPFPHFWKRCVGSGHMLLGTRSDWRQHLTLANSELGFTGIRGHGLLDDDMSTLPRKGSPPSFYNVDQVFDFLMSLGIRPVVELSFMPSALVSCGPDPESPRGTCQYSFGDHGGCKSATAPQQAKHSLAPARCSRWLPPL